jgi:hypothetical protein
MAKQITARTVKQIFGGGRIVVEGRPLFCAHCDEDLRPEYERLYASGPMDAVVALLKKRRGRIIRVTWPSGHCYWGCHACGREVKNHEG